jgi:DNA-binding CsgD family transcriptional regulator
VATERFAVAAATLSLLATAAEQQPVVAIVDDAHWIDQASREAMLFTARRLDADSVLMLFGVREGETDVFDESGVQELNLAALDAEPARELVSGLSAGRAKPDVVDGLIAAAAGNPLALIETTRSLSDGQLAGTDPLDELMPAAQSVERAFLRRAARLGDPARRALLVAAVGTSDGADEIEAACAAQGIEPAALAEVQGAGLVTRAQQIEFRHPLLRAAIYRAATPAERDAAHRALADVMRADGAAERRAWHLAAAARAPDDAVAVELAEAAAAARARGALPAAARALERSAALTPDDAVQAQRLLEAAGHWQLAGRSERSRDLLAEAAELSSKPTLRSDIEHLHGQIEMWAGLTPQARERLSRTAAEIEPHDRTRAALINADAALAALLAGDVAGGTDLARRAYALAEPLGAELVALTGPIVGNALALAGKLEEAAPFLRAYRHVPAEALSPSALIQIPPPLTWLEQYDEARALLDRLAAIGRSLSAPSILAPALMNLTELDFRTGNWTDGYATGTEALALAAEGAGQTLHLVYGILSRIEAGRGLDQDCARHAEAGLTMGRERGDGSAIAYSLSALGLLDLGRGRAGEAADRLLELDVALESMGVVEPTVVFTLPDLVEALVRAGRTEEAEQSLDKLARRARASGLVWPNATAARCAGLLASDEEFEDHFRAALAWHERAPQAFERARTHLCFGERLRRARQATAAREHLRTAADVFARLGARPWIERADGELAATGERRRARGPETSELTPRELQIALLVAQGATNKEAAAALFVTAKTIEFHLGHVYRKLGVRSRTELAARMQASDRRGAEQEGEPRPTVAS